MSTRTSRHNGGAGDAIRAILSNPANVDMTPTEIARRAGCSRVTVYKIRDQFQASGANIGTKQKSRSGARLAVLQLRSDPATSHLTCKELADRTGCGRESAERWLRQAGMGNPPGKPRHGTIAERIEMVRQWIATDATAIDASDSEISSRFKLEAALIQQCWEDHFAAIDREAGRSYIASFGALADHRIAIGSDLDNTDLDFKLAAANARLIGPHQACYCHRRSWEIYQARKTLKDRRPYHRQRRIDARSTHHAETS